MADNTKTVANKYNGDSFAGTKKRIAKTLLYIFLILLAALCFMPFLLMLVNSTRSGNEIMT